MVKAFISYRREALESVTDLVQSIEVSHDVWFDQRNELSQPWWQTILEQISDCDVFIAVFDPDYTASWYCMQELEYASALGKTLVPVLLPDVPAEPILPDSIDRFPRVRYEPGTRESQSEILKTLRTVATWQPPDNWPMPPAYPVPGVTELWDQLYHFPHSVSESDIYFSLSALKSRGADEFQLARLVDEFCQRDIKYEVGAQARALLDGRVNSDDHLADQQHLSELVDPIVKSALDSEETEHSEDARHVGTRTPDVRAGRRKFAIPLATLLVLVVGVAAWFQLKNGKPSKSLPVSFKSASTVYPTMIQIPGGPFEMGSATSEDKDEKPVRTVTVDPFSISETEITFDQYDAYIADSGIEEEPADDKGWGRADRPVINVSWHQASRYGQWLTDQLADNSSMTCGLPTEAEWEFAARGGANTAYHWGEDAGMANEYAWYGLDWTDGTQPIRKKEPNGFGLYDTAGNVWEWVQDCYRNSYEGAPIDGTAVLGDSCPSRSLRGGAFNDFQLILRAAIRFSNLPGNRVDDVGFRVVCRPHP